MRLAPYLANRIAGAAPVQRGQTNIPTLTAQQVSELQRLLNARGFDVGKADGMGWGTRGAVKQAQMLLGLAADSYPNMELIERLRR